MNEHRQRHWQTSGNKRSIREEDFAPHIIINMVQKNKLFNPPARMI